MKEELEQFIRDKVKAPSRKEIDEILGVFQHKHFEKGHVIKSPGTICQKGYFLIEGNIRLFALKADGTEITLRVTGNNEFFTDFISIRTKEATPIGIEAYENCSVLMASYDQVKPLLDTNLSLNILLREYIAERAVAMGKFHYLFLTGTAKDRYKYLIENKPRLIHKFPLRFIASMIGITPTQLSRIRNKKS